MRFNSRRLIAISVASLGLLSISLSSLAHAHFPWLATDGEGRALLFFGESPEERTYHTPEAIAQAKVLAHSGDEKATELDLAIVEEDDYIGRRSAKPVAKDAALEMTCEYGLYHGMLLTYYARHLPGDGATAWEKAGAAKNLKLSVAAKPAKEQGGLTIAVAWDGKPLKDAGVSLADASGESQEGRTDDRGEVIFKKVAGGLVGVTANFVEEVKGKVDGKEYHSAGHYATLTLQNGKQAVAKETADKVAATDLPEPVASFGGAVADGWLYLYSGHIGGEHEHSKDNLSQSFRRKEIGGKQWEELPMETPLQGLPLVAHGGKLYRVGGLSALNAEGEDEDIHSVAEFSCFDPATKTWAALAPLPEARSSHDAVVIGDTLYVVGGWKLEGSSKGTWLDTAWSFDLTKPDGAWVALPSPAFRRRALAVAQWDGKLIALGGMGEDHDISRSVDALDLKTGEWTKLADLPGEGMDGFGVSAWNLDGKLYASGTQDSLFRLSDDGKTWEPIAELTQPRFFHRLLPGKPGILLAVGGASEEGHLADVEELSPKRRPTLEQ
jgi:hypothetical protein